MAICSTLAPNGNKSDLYDKLYEKYGFTKAQSIWNSQIRSQQFFNKFGDWEGTAKDIHEASIAIRKYADALAGTDDAAKAATRKEFEKLFEVTGTKAEVNATLEEIRKTLGFTGGVDIVIGVFRKSVAIDNMEVDSNDEPTIEWIEANLPGVVPQHTFTFPDGKTITSPFEFTADQKKTFNDLFNWYVKGEHAPVEKGYEGFEKTYLIQGNAGTGKSSTIGYFVQYLIENGYLDPTEIGFSSPSHKANKVLFRFAMKIKAFGNLIFGKPKKQDYDNQVFTTQAAFGVKIRVNKRTGMEVTAVKGKSPGYGKLVGNAAFTKKRLWIIDEISMLDESYPGGLNKMIEHIKFYNSQDITVIMMGDEKQLTNPTSNRVSPFFGNHNKSVLKEEVRQAKDNPLLGALAPVKYALDNGKEIYGLPSYTSKVNKKGEGIVFLKGLTTNLMKMFTSPEYQKERTHTKVITRSNAAVRQYNQMIRNFIFGGRQRTIEVNDTFMGYDQRKPGSEGVQNGQEYIVDSVQYNQEFNLKQLLSVTSVPSKIRSEYMNVINALPEGISIGDKVKLREDAPIFENIIETHIIDTNTDFQLSKVQNAADIYRTLIQRASDAQIALDNHRYDADNKANVARFFELLNIKDAHDAALQNVVRHIQFRTSLFTDTKTGDTISENTAYAIAEAEYEEEKNKLQLWKQSYVEEKLKKRVYIEHTIDYGYAITVTKSQGSTYKYPIVDLQSIEGKNNSWYRRREDGHTNADVLRLLYVAESRASGVAFNLTPKGDMEDVEMSEDGAPQLASTEEEGGGSDEIGVVPQDIHTAATAKNIPWDDNVEFMDKSEELTGKRKLDEMDQAQLKTILDWVNAQPVRPKPVVPLNIAFQTGENAILSNIAQRPFTGKDGRQYFSVEHAYQTWKSGTFDKDTYAAYKSGRMQISGKLGVKMEEDWNLQLLKGLMRRSFEQNEKARNALVATADTPLTATVEDAFWSREFPRILMELRTEFIIGIKPPPPPVLLVPPKPKVYTSTVDRTLEPEAAGARLDEALMLENVKKLYAEARANPNVLFNVPYVYNNNKDRFFSGYTARELANFLDSDKVPDNVQFTPGFQGLIQNSTRRIIEEMGRNVPAEFMQRDQIALDKAMLDIALPKIHDSGQNDGVFTPQQHQQLIETVIEQMKEKIKLNSALTPAKAIVAVFNTFRKARIHAPYNEQLRQNFSYVYNSREKLTGDVLTYMESLGWKMSPEGRRTILNAVRNNASINDKQSRSIEGADPAVEALDDQADVLDTVEFERELGEQVRDWADVAMEQDPKSGASAELRMFFATLPEVDDSLQPVFNFMGFKIMADYGTMFEDCMAELANRPRDFQGYMAALRKSVKPSLQYLADELDKQDESLKNQFFKVMSKQYQDFSMPMFERKKNFNTGQTEYDLKVINANRYSQRDTILNYWKQSNKLSDMMITNAAGERVMDVRRVKEKWLKVIEVANKITDWSGAGTKLDQDRIENIKQFLVGMFNNMGMNFTREMVDYMFDNMSMLTLKDKSYSGGVAKQFSVVGEKEEPGGIFSAFIYAAAGMTNKNDRDLPDELLQSRAEKNNPLYHSSAKILARVAAMFTPRLHSNSFRNAEGKLIWGYGQNTKLSHLFREMSQDKGAFDAFLAKRSNVDIANLDGNWLLEAFRNNPQLRNNISLQYLDALKPVWGKNRGTTRSKASDREQALMSIVMFQNKGEGFKRNNPQVHYLSLTHSDKTMTPLFMHMPKIHMPHPARVGFDENGNTLVNSLVMDKYTPMYNVFKAEHDRITRQKNVNYNNSQYDQGKGYFYFLPQFNFDGMNGLVASGTITQDEMNLIWLGGARNLTTVIGSAEMRVVNKILTRHILDLTNDTVAKWKGMGIVSERTDENGVVVQENMFDRDYVQKLQSEVLKGPPDNDMLVQAAAMDYAVNYFLFNTAMSQLLFGDPAMEFKAPKGVANPTDLDYVRSTMAEYAKRLAKDIAPGSDGNWPPHKMTVKTITLADVETTEDYVPEGLKRFYAKTNATDAQEFTTMQEALDVDFYVHGKMSRKVYDEMSQIITDAGKGGYYKFELPEHLAVITGPSKPVFAGQRARADRGALLEDYIKSSSYPLYPPMVEGTEMDKMRIFMERNGVQRTHFASAKKVGNPTQPARMFDKNGNFNELLAPAEIAGAVRDLNRSGFRIQQEVPYDETKEAIKTLSQVDVLISSGIGHLDGFEVPGHGSMNGKDVRKLKEKVRMQMIQQNVDNFLNKLGITPEDYRALREGRTLSQPQKEKLYDILVEEVRKKGYTINEQQSLLIRTDTGDPVIPVWLNPAASKFESRLISVIRQLVKTEMPGKSFVQASSVGYTFKDPVGMNTSRMIRTGSWDGSPLKTMRVGPDGKILPAQIIVPFNFVDSDGNRLNIEDYLLSGTTNRLDMSLVPPELLQMFGARVPNQGYSSMLPMEIVAFVPSTMGDVVYVPSAITNQMGADFDVDKLFTYRRPYNVSVVNKTMTAIGGTTRANTVERLGANPQEFEDLKALARSILGADKGANVPREVFNRALSEAVDQRYPDGNVPKHFEELAEGEIPSRDRLQATYFDIHWAVMTHPEMINTILSPLDKSDMKDENQLLAQKKAGVDNFFHVMTQLENFQSGKDAKSLVAMSALALKFNGNIQDKSLYYQVPAKEQGYERGYITVKVGDELLELTNLSGNGTSTYQGEVRSKHDNYSILLTTAVDNAKDRALDNLNLNTITFRAANALIQLETSKEKSVNLTMVTRLLTQPIILELVAEMRKGNDSLSEKFNKNLKLELYNTLRAKYASQYSSTRTLEAEVRNIVFSPELLLEAQSMKDDALVLHQVAALDLYFKLDEIGETMFKLQAISNSDTAGAGKNILHAMEKQETQNNLNDGGTIANAATVFGTTEGITETGMIFQATVGMTNTVLTKIMPYDKFGRVFERIKMLSNRDTLSNEQQRKILTALNSFVYTKGQHWWQSSQADRIRLLYGEQSLGKRIIAARTTEWGKSNRFLGGGVLEVNVGDTVTSPDFVTFQAGTADTMAQRLYEEAWLSLLNSDDPVQRHLGEDLLRYSYLTGGHQDSNSFVKFVPIAYLANTEFSAMLQNVHNRTISTTSTEDIDRMFGAFSRQYMQHNPELAVQTGQELFGQQPERQEFPERFIVPNPETEEFTNRKLGYLIGPENALVPYISYRNRVDGTTILFQKEGRGKETTSYVRVDTLGNEYTDEYDGETDRGQRSIFPENRALAEVMRPDNAADGIEAIRSSSYGSYYSNNDYFEQIGVQEGMNFRTALSLIKNNKSLPQHLRTVAEMLLRFNSEEINQFAELTLMIGEGDRTDSINYFDSVIEKGAYTIGTGIKVNPKNAISQVDAAETMMHELMHERLQTILMAFGFDDRIWPGIIARGHEAQWRRRIEKLQAKHPEVMEHLNALERLRYEAYNHLQGNAAQSNNADLQYAFSTLQEFVAHLMTNQETIEYLNGVQSSEGQTLLSRIWNVLTSLIASFAQSMGVKVKEGSILQEAIARTLKLSTFDDSGDVQITTALRHGTTLVVNNEMEAERTKDVAEQVYQRKTDVHGNELGFTVNISNSKRAAPVVVYTAVDKVLMKLALQKEDAEMAINSARTKQELVAAKVRLGDLEEDIDNLTRERDLELISTIVAKQIEWGNSVLSSPNPSDVDVLIAIKLADTWSGLSELMHDTILHTEDANPAVLAAQEDARRLRKKLNNLSWTVYEKAMKGKLTFNHFDRGEKLLDINKAESLFRAITTVKTKLIQGIGLLGKQEADNSLEEIRRTSIRLGSLMKKMQDFGVSDADIMQRGGWGLIQRVSNNWGETLRSENDKRKSMISAAIQAKRSGTTEENAADRKDMMNMAYQMYWDAIGDQSAVVDTRYMFDILTGETAKTTKRDELFQKLVSEVGSEEYAQELVDEAQAKYKEYLDEKRAYNDTLLTMELTEEEAKDKTFAEKQTLTKEKRKKALDKWIGNNSPNAFLNTQNVGSNAREKYTSSKWTVIAPKTTTTYLDRMGRKQSYYDERFLTMSSKMQEIKKEFQDFFQEYVGYLPERDKDRTDESFIPAVSKRDANTLASMAGAIRNWDATLMNHLGSRTHPDEVSTDSTRKIPVKYMRAVKEEDIETMSTDLIRVAELFAMMAIHYKYMSRVLPAIQIAENIIKDHNRRASEPGSELELIKNGADAVEYFQDVLIFKRPRQLQAGSSHAIYIISQEELSKIQGNPATAEKVRQRIVKLNQRKEDIFKQIEKNQEEMVWDSSEFDQEIKDIDKELNEYGKYAHYLYGSKSADTLITINQFKQLGFAPFSALSNFVFGTASVSIHAYSRKDYDPKSLRWAWGKMTNSSMKYSTFSGVNNDEAQKIHNLMGIYGIMSELEDSEYGESNIKGKKSWKSRILKHAFNWQQSGDYAAKGAMLLAMLRFKTVDVTIDGTTQKIPLYDALDTNGEWNEAKYGRNDLWYSQDITQQEEKMKFRSRAKAVAAIVFGNQDRNSPMLAKKDFLWRLAGQFRMSWLAEGIATRFAGERESGALGRETKGRYRTYFDLGWRQSTVVMFKQLLSSLPGMKVDSFKGIVDEHGKAIGETDMENMRKNFAGAAWTIGTLAVMLALSSFGDDKKGRRKTAEARKRQFVMNLLIRAYQDLMLYASPAVVDTVSGNLVPALTVVTDAWKAVVATNHYLWNQDEKDAGVKALKKTARVFPIANLWPKTENLMTRGLDTVGK